MTKLSLLFSFLVAFHSLRVQGQPADWYKNTKGLAIDSSEQLDHIIDTQRDKFILLDFYMQQCHWCFVF